MRKLLPYILIISPFCGITGCKDEKPATEKCVSGQIVEVIPQVMDRVVYIQAPSWQGSGFVVSPHLIATARHVIEGCDDFTITYNDGSKVKATRAISMKKYDVGFIYVPDGIWIEPLKLGSISDCVLGQPVVVIGSPFGKINFNRVSSGIISKLDCDWEEINPYTGEFYGWEVGFGTDTSGSPGSSGCPVFTLDGKVIGILVGGYNSTTIFCVPCDLFADQLGDIEAAFRVEADYELEEARYATY